jgi:hypothetical protein
LHATQTTAGSIGRRAGLAAFAITAAAALALAGAGAAEAGTGQAGATATTCTAAQLLGNPGFETGTAAPWSASAGVINPIGGGEAPHSGSWYAWLDGYGITHTDTLQQTVTVPLTCTNKTFSFWLHIDTAETTTTTPFDKLQVQVISSLGTSTLATFSNLNHTAGYVNHTYSLAAYAGKSITVRFTGTEDASLQTSFVIDDTAVINNNNS